MYTELQASYHWSYFLNTAISAPKSMIITYRNETPIHKHEKKNPASFECMLKKGGGGLFL